MLAFGTWPASVFLLLGAVLFFIFAIINRQGNDHGLSFHFLASMIGMVAYAIVGWFFSVKYGFIIGLVAGIVLGVFVGYQTGGEE